MENQEMYSGPKVKITWGKYGTEFVEIESEPGATPIKFDMRLVPDSRTVKIFEGGFIVPARGDSPEKRYSVFSARNADGLRTVLIECES
jgi:hypothetical protein